MAIALLCGCNAMFCIQMYFYYFGRREKVWLSEKGYGSKYRERKRVLSKKGGQKNQQYKYYMEDEETRKERASGMFWKAEKQKGMLRKRTYETTVLTSKFIFKK